MAPRWESSTAKHGVPRADVIYAIVNATYVSELVDEGSEQGRIMLYIGHPHGQTSREIEILVHEYPETGREASIFHAMPLGPKFRKYREEHHYD